MSQFNFSLNQVYKIKFFDSILDFTVTKINSKGITLNNEATRIVLKDYKEIELSKMIITQVK